MTRRALMLPLGTLLAVSALSAQQTPISSTAPSSEKQLLIYVKHLEPPLRYPPIARGARLQGTVAIKLKIAADGNVLSTESSSGDKDTIGFPVLRDDAEKIVKTWTFGCAGCPPNAPFEHTIKFKYSLVSDDDVYVHAHIGVLMNLPDEVTIKTDSDPCDHCPPSKTSKKGSH